MIIIGKIAEYKNNYPQRSKEHRALATAMSEEVGHEMLLVIIILML